MAELKKVKASMMNAIHDLPLLVARDEGFFRDEGLDVDILVTPGSGQHNSDDRALKDDIFKRGLEATYDQGQCDQFRMCEWGIMKRAVETIQEKNLRPAKIVALGSAMSSFAIVVDPRSGIYEPEQLKNVPIAVSQYNGSHFTMLKMMEGFIKRDEIKIANHGTHRQRMEAVMSGKVKAASLQEPWISVAEAKGGRVIIESHSTRSEAAGDEMDGPTLAKMFRAEARAAEAIQKNPEKFAHYIVAEAGGLIGAEGPQAVAHPQRAADAVHARAVRRQLQLDARLGPGAARRDLREHGRQPRLAVSERAVDSRRRRRKRAPDYDSGSPLSRNERRSRCACERACANESARRALPPARLPDPPRAPDCGVAVPGGDRRARHHQPAIRHPAGAQASARASTRSRWRSFSASTAPPPAWC